MKFRIYYCDREPYSGSTDKDAWFAPQTGVQVVVVEDKASAHGSRIVHSKHHYYWKEGLWWPCDESGKDDYMMLYRGPKAVLYTRTMGRSKDFWAIVEQATEERLGS